MSSLLLVQFKADRCLCVCSKFHIFSSKKKENHLNIIFLVSTMLMHTHTISFNYPPITNDFLYPAPQYILWNCCVYPRGRDVRLHNTLPCTVYEVLEYMSVLHETFVTRLTHYPVCPLPGSSGTRHVRITHPARQPGTSGFRYAPSSKRPCTVVSVHIGKFV